MLMKLVAKFAASLAVLGLSFNVLAAELNVYASMPEKYASQVLEQFTKETGIKVNFLRLSSGEVLSRLQAEKSNPQVDVLLGGPADYLEVAKNEGLTAPYKPKGSDFIPAEFKDPQNCWTGIGIMPLAFITNNNFLKKNNLKAPTSWQDFLKPEYKEGLILADARTSGTATERLFSLERVFGREGSIDFQKKLHKNVQMYTKSGAWPALRVGDGLAAAAMVYLPDALDIVQLGYPVTISYPKEGVTFGIEVVSLVKGAKHPKEAKEFLDWATSPKLAEFLIKNKIRYVPTRTDVKVDDPVLDLKNIHMLGVPLSEKGRLREQLTKDWIDQVLQAK